MRSVSHSRASSQQGHGLEGMGSTATVAGILDDFLYLGQVGDSRAYLIRNGSVFQLTRDQSVVQELVEAGKLTEEEAVQSRRRNMILQALGIAPSVSVDLTYQQLRRGDTLLLCSDGLSGPVQPQEMATVLEQVPDLVQACDRLVALANERGGPDNITVVLARVDGDGLEDPSPADDVSRRVFELA